MTENERLAKNIRIREQGKLTRERRKSQICRVYRVKIDISHLNEAQKTHLKMLFVEAKWLYNDALTFMIDHDISVIQGIKHSLKVLASLKERNHKVGSLRYKSDYESINLQQHQTTYRFYDEYHIGLQGFKERIRIKGANQFWNIPNIEFANAKLQNLPDGYYLAITTYQPKGGEQRKYKPEIGIDTANKIMHELLEHEHVYMQDENLKGWHKGLFGRTVQHSILGLVKAALMRNERVTVLPARVPTMKYCPECRRLKRDIHAARNMILLSKRDTCGMQETFNPTFGEDIRRLQPI